MQKKTFGISLFTGLLSVLSCFAQNPIIQTYYTADPAPMVHNGTVYLYTSHDEDVTVKNFFTMNDWRCYSSKDMVNWTDHGAILSYKDFSWSRGDAWAGQCIFRDGKFYYYLPVNQKNGGNAIGVAISDSPTAGFKDAIGKPLLSGFGYIDPTVFIDDEGQAYLYWGNPQLYYVKLNKDMVSYDEKVGIVKVPLDKQGFSARKKDPEKRPSEYEEGPWFFKRKSKYYLIYPAGGVPEHLAYSTSQGPTGPWIYGDTIMKVIEDRGAFTNHPGYIDFKGQSYLFYHDGALPGGGGFKRSVCIEPFSFNPDGSIPRINRTKAGVLKSAANLNPYNRVEAETIAWSEGVKTAKDSLTGAIYVSNIDNGDYIKIRSVDFGKGATKFEATVASLSSKGNIELRADGLNGKLLGKLEVKSTKNTRDWKAQLCKINQITGVYDLYLVFKGEGNDLFNFDSWRLIR
ncbi:glycoside hydrolase family 43 protein [Pedobacter sp. PF22-3]|uniref:glycoside hydrolase family 43 protein n=1 Tax=Pedobacter sp. PF22-3 TaxID=2994467 RepID=UPI0022482665|nr:glycoside hydrolase family 43 protein [Pedobacter sp. PF22-3]MCX2492731.1 glycoside hydrolase family 43 protein [Pedobacter sp. PF22-3]